MTMNPILMSSNPESNWKTLFCSSEHFKHLSSWLWRWWYWHFRDEWSGRGLAVSRPRRSPPWSNCPLRGCGTPELAQRVNRAWMLRVSARTLLAEERLSGVAHHQWSLCPCLRTQSSAFMAAFTMPLARVVLYRADSDQFTSFMDACWLRHLHCPNSWFMVITNGWELEVNLKPSQLVYQKLFESLPHINGPARQPDVQPSLSVSLATTQISFLHGAGMSWKPSFKWNPTCGKICSQSKSAEVGS